MPQTTKETITIKEHSSSPTVQSTVKNTTLLQNSKSLYAEQVLYFFLGILEILLSFRFILKLLGASQSSGFVRFIYRISNIFIFPFEGIFRRAISNGIETASVIEPATLVACIVYAVLAWILISFIRMFNGETQSE